MDHRATTTSPPVPPKAPLIRLRFFVAYSAPSSRTALATLESVLDGLADRVEVEVIDVMQSPERALDEGILVTPALVRLSPGPKRVLIGDLRGESALRRFLQDSGLTFDA